MILSTLLADLLLLFSATVNGRAPLPSPIDVPHGPPNVQAPGGARLPDIGGSAAPNAPAISAISEMTLPGETLVITGANLQHASLRVWAEGSVWSVQALEAADDRMLAVLPPSLPVSTMLVWPVRAHAEGGESAGAPIRVNAATAWWSWPPRLVAGAAGHSIRFFGKSLRLPNVEPRAYLQGPIDSPQGEPTASTWLQVKSSHPYHLEAALPDDLRPGKYLAWAHNGTGGSYGWSEPVSLDVVQMPSPKESPVFRVDDFGAKPDDADDDSAAILAAVAAAAKTGGGIIEFSSGEYNLEKPVETPPDAPRGIHFRGVGLGSHDPRTHRLAGRHTAIRSLDAGPLPSQLLEIKTRYSRLSAINFVNGADGRQQLCVDIRAHDVVVEDCRFVILDRRPQVPMTQRKALLIDNGALQLNAPGPSNIVVRRCEFHTPGAGIRIGLEAQRATYPFTDHVAISDCVFRGYFTGVYKSTQRRDKPQGFLGPRESGYRSCGVVNDNGKHTIIERCDFAGADRYHGLVMGRTIQCHNSAVRGQYWADNRAHDVGNHSSLGPVNHNMGEQYMFHFAYEGGGLFDVVEAGPRSVTVNPSDPKYAGLRPQPSTETSDLAGSVVPEDVEKNDHWVVFVCAGKGVGQYRVVTGVRRTPQRVTLEVDRPWRVVPAATSRVVLQVVYRQNIVYHNLADTGRLDPAHKSHGVIFWYNSIDNIVAANTFRNLTAGVVLNHGFRNPTAWNLVRDNVMENIAGYSGDTSRSAACYVTHFRARRDWPQPEDRVWYSVGDVARGNRGTEAETAAFVHARFERKGGGTYVPHPDGGAMMPVVENNRFSRAGQGIIVGSPANWALIRNNTVATTAPGAPPVFDETSSSSADQGLYLRKE